jgi:phosphate transport system permease protein
MAAGEPAFEFGSAMTARRRAANLVATGWMVASVVAVVVPLALVLGYVLLRGAAALDLSFFTQAEPLDFTQHGGGFRHGIQGTIKVVGLATLVAVPVGLACAIWLVEYGRGWLAGAVRFVADVMTGVPSVFVGIFAYSFLVLRIGHFAAWTGSAALALMMLPIVVRGCEEVLRLVPGELREASLALGVPRWRTTLSVVVPSAASGLTTAVMLAVARAAGETAPLLFTSFGSRVVTGWTSFNEPDSALPLLIYRNARSAYAPAQERAWAGAFVLIAMVLALTIGARLLAARSAKGRS